MRSNERKQDVRLFLGSSLEDDSYSSDLDHQDAPKAVIATLDTPRQNAFCHGEVCMLLVLIVRCT